MKIKLIALCLFVSCVASATQYHFQPGQKITYDWTQENFYPSGTQTTSGKTTVWTAKGVGDQAHQLIFLTEYKDVKEVYYANVSSNGAFAGNGTIKWGTSPLPLIPWLPKTKVAKLNGWSFHETLLDQDYKLKNKHWPKTQKDPWIFGGTIVRKDYELFGIEQRITYTLQAGSIQSYDFTLIEKATGKLEARTRYKRTSVATEESLFLTTLAAQVQKWGTVNAQYGDTIALSGGDPFHVDDYLAQAKKVLEEARKELDHPLVHAQLEHKISKHAELETYVKSYAEYAKQFIG